MADVNVLDLVNATPGTDDSLILFDRNTGEAKSARYTTLRDEVLNSRFNISSPAADQELTYDATSGKWKNTTKITALTSRVEITENGMRRTRSNITSRLTNLATAISERNLKKYNYSIGDYFTGPSGYTYFIADEDTYYGGYNSYAVVNTRHIGLVVKTGTTSVWNETNDTSTGYTGSVLHDYLSTTVLDNIKNDMISLFGGTTGLEHLIKHQKKLSTAIDAFAWQTDQYISALSEVQVYGSVVRGADGGQIGEACRQLEIFRKYRFNEIIGNTSWWLRDISSAVYACRAPYSGNASYGSASLAHGAVGLILFK